MDYENSRYFGDFNWQLVENLKKLKTRVVRHISDADNLSLLHITQSDNLS